nr:MAG TPA: hypothetical protein [Bacteriophage sp.]
MLCLVNISANGLNGAAIYESSISYYNNCCVLLLFKKISLLSFENKFVNTSYVFSDVYNLFFLLISFF